MMSKIAAVAALAVVAAPAFAETGVGTIQIDNVSGVYGRADIAMTRVSGVVVTRGTDVNVSGRDSIGTGAGTTVLSANESVDQSYGRS